MNQSLESRLAVELKEFFEEGVAGDAITNYLLDLNGKKIKVPNIIYCVLQMLGDEHEGKETMYTEYCGKCFLCKEPDCLKCQVMLDEQKKGVWRFWYTKQENATNITAIPINSLEIKQDCNIVDTGENDIYFKMYAKFAYQCMAVYDTERECYLPEAVFRMAEYMLFLFSYKAFFAAMKSAVKYCNEEMNYAIRETLGTALGLKDVQRKDLYKSISRMQGREKAAVTGIITKWGSGGGLQQGLYDVIHKFERSLQMPEVRKWIVGNEYELKMVLGEELFFQLQEHCNRNVML